MWCTAIDIEFLGHVNRQSLKSSIFGRWKQQYTVSWYRNFGDLYLIGQLYNQFTFLLPDNTFYIWPPNRCFKRIVCHNFLIIAEKSFHQVREKKAEIKGKGKEA